MKFADLGLSEAVLKAVAESGYETPTPIQEKAIPWVMQGRDVLGTAQTGTGKTAGFTLPLIDILDGGRARARMPRALILEPTRELADQVAASFEKYGKYSKLSMALLIGGVSMDEQIKTLDRGVDVLIATPGRLLDHFERGRVMLTGVQVLVIDEADRMMDMGFMPDVERIVKLIPPLRQTLFFSATMPTAIKRLADQFLSNPKEVAVAAQSSTAENVDQKLVKVSPRRKHATLVELIESESVQNAIVFCNRKVDVDKLHKSLVKDGLNAARIHGDLAQSIRMETLEKFKTGEIAILVASDVAARGLDVKGLSHVFNFDVPIHAEDYVHRIGRTGRAGQKGKSITLVTDSDDKYVSAIVKLIGKQIPMLDATAETEAVIAPVDGEPAVAPAPVEGGEEPSPERRGRSRRDRPARGRERERQPRPEREPIAERAPRAEREARPEGETRAARPPRAERAPRAERQVAEAPASTRRERPQFQAVEGGRNDRPKPERRQRDDDREPMPVGFGDDVPAFLLRPSQRKRG